MERYRTPGPLGFLFLSAVSLVVSAGANAQEGIPPAILERLRAQALAAEQVMPGMPGATAADPAKKPAVDAARMKALKTLVLDRRPSTILATWAKPEPKAVADDPELKLPKGPPVAPKAPTPPKPPTPPKDGKKLTPEEQKSAAEALKKAGEAHQKAMVEFQKVQVEYTKKNAEYTTKNAEYTTKKKAVELKILKREMELFARNVTLGRWDRLPKALAKFGKTGAAQAYQQLLTRLSRAPTKGGSSRFTQFAEKNSFSFDDILALTGIAPGGLKKNQTKSFPALLNLAFARGHSFDGWLKRLRIESAKPKGERRFDRRMAALFLAAHNKDIEMGEFLPSLAAAVKAEDREALNLLSRHHVAEHAKEQKPEFLEKAWEATLAALAVVDKEPAPKKKVDKRPDSKKPVAKKPDAKKTELDPAAKAAALKKAALAKAEALRKEKEAKARAARAKALAKAQKVEALRRATELAPKVRDELGNAWLEESFTINPKRGMEVIATIGGQASQGMMLKAYDTDFRLKGLQLLKSAVDALLEKAPKRATEWRETLNLLADVWLREAQHAYRYSQANRMGPYSQRDRYGNIYWMNYGSGYFNSAVRPLEPAQLLELRPDGKWRSMLDDSVRAKYDTTIAELYLKVSEEKLAFPYIEQLAKTELKRANELAKEFLNVWIQNNDPNTARNRSNIYNYSYGFNRRASGIPLTRSKQERNLRDLAKWVGKLRAIKKIKLDTALLLRAFTSSHSSAEVYRIETMERVFGSLDDLEPKILASMAQTMRANLATTWRIPAVQQQAGTKRKQKDIQAEVQKGYAMAQALLGRALQAHPDNWSLMVARAAMIHDLNNYQNKIQKSAEFSGNRRDALKMFASAAAIYSKKVPDLRTNEETVQPFEFWFNAALGASDINAIDQSTILARHEIPKIKKALDDIPGEAGIRHRSKFANALFTKLSSVNPAVKNRFLEVGFAIVGDHPQAKSARKVYDYYKDLITEIEMVAKIDGSTDVGLEPFGMTIDLRYTVQIERESGGFGKYLQNQANNVGYYNYGRPPENYRDKFEDSIRTTLEEQFEVMSVTFNSEDVGSKSSSEFGWRRTPYAYVLLKAKGAEVDRIPPMKMDLDFLDVTGYVVLPLISAVVPLDASAKPAVRPFEDLSITEILDERKSKDGLLNLEIKADARGLVPKLEDVLTVASSDFEVQDIVDQGVSVSRFGDDKDSIRTERLWVISMKAKAGVENPTSFKFPVPTDEETEVVYQRYDDADLMVATAEVKLLSSYSEPAGLSMWWLALPVVLLLGGILWFTSRRTVPVAESVGLELPANINSLTVLGLLQELRQSRNLDDAKRRELDEAIAQIEHHYFGGWESAAPDLHQIAEHWVRRA